MVERIGNAGALAREALRAAQRVAPELAPGARNASEAPASFSAELAPSTGGALDEQAVRGAGESVDLGGALRSGVDALDRRVRAAEELPLDLLSGKVSDFHEIAVQLKSSELSFRFAMEIRNKLVDAYREIMRMSV